ncbi:hypothetical protein [Peijinzhouia sedimentorum]
MNNREEINIHFLGQFIQEGIYVLPEEQIVSMTSIIEERREENPPVADLAQSEEIIPKLPQIGEFRKQVLILVNNPQSDGITEEEKDFFNKLIPAIKLTWPDVAAVNINSLVNYKQDLQDFINSYDYKFLLAFTGKLPTLKFSIDGNLFESIKSAGKIHLVSNPVSELNQSKALKVGLWNELQRIF